MIAVIVLCLFRTVNLQQKWHQLFWRSSSVATVLLHLCGCYLFHWLLQQIGASRAPRGLAAEVDTVGTDSSVPLPLPQSLSPVKCACVADLINPALFLVPLLLNSYEVHTVVQANCSPALWTLKLQYVWLHFQEQLDLFKEPILVKSVRHMHFNLTTSKKIYLPWIVWSAEFSIVSNSFIATLNPS